MCVIKCKSADFTDFTDLTKTMSKTIVEIQFNPWDKIYNFDPEDIQLLVGDQAVVKTDLGMELGKVVGFKSLEDEELKAYDELKPILRKATTGDLEKFQQINEKSPEAVEFCKKMIAKHSLPMKLIDVRFSFDGGRITFAFIADGRVDFRSLVKDLTRYFQKSVRLHQLGIRDEARMTGDIGPCGRGLCCRNSLKALHSVTGDLAEIQQVAHRGSDRISGSCGRLMCCLTYEKENYEELSKNLPPSGVEVSTSKGKGLVTNRHILKQVVDVRLKDGTMVEVAPEEIKKVF